MQLSDGPPHAPQAERSREVSALRAAYESELVQSRRTIEMPCSVRTRATLQASTMREKSLEGDRYAALRELGAVRSRRSLHDSTLSKPLSCQAVRAYGVPVPFALAPFPPCHMW